MSSGSQLFLRCDAEAAHLARRAVADRYPRLAPAVRDDVSLLVTELVTNAVRHGDIAPDRSIRVDFECDGGLLKVQVVDPGTEFAAPPLPSGGDGSGGWGLFLVDRIAQRWGVRPAASGTCVWFELPA